MSSFPSEFEFATHSLAEIRAVLQPFGVDKAVLKVLPKNANDKNQVYVASSYTSLHNLFDLKLSERGPSTSETKGRSSPGSQIPEAVFADFSWLRRTGTPVRVRNLKVIVYTQYPEARLSGFVSVEQSMPRSLSIEFTKQFPERKRILVLGRIPGGGCVAMISIDPDDRLVDDVAALPGLEGSRVCKILEVSTGGSARLFGQLAAVAGRSLPGCRLDAFGNTLPFTGTQVCGYTLEHALGIAPNSGRDGDLYGIELKTHTSVKLTLFTPEPDSGLYAQDYARFMTTYGYLSGDEYRVTGIHRAGERCAKSGLTLQVREFHVDTSGVRVARPYQPRADLTAMLNDVDVALIDDQGVVAASWSLQRLMNNWGVKHNEVVYLTADKQDNTDADQLRDGFRYRITFAPRVMWCRGSSAERLVNAIHSGQIYLDPAPKYVPSDLSRNKRRSQWRVNDITKVVPELYSSVEWIDLSAMNSPAVTPETRPVRGHSLVTQLRLPE